MKNACMMRIVYKDNYTILSRENPVYLIYFITVLEIKPDLWYSYTKKQIFISIRRKKAVIKFEDKELEKFVLSGQSCIAVPVEIYVSANGETEFTVYSICRDTAEEFERKFCGSELSPVALAWLEGELYSFAENTGYRRFHSDNEKMLEYEISDICHLNKNTKSGKCQMISDNSELAALCKNTGCDIEINGGDDVIFAVVENGVILSYAGVNDIDHDGISLEISVETMPDEIRKGYGSACVVALSEYLIERGYKVLYKCSSNNIASAALAEKCGFSFSGTRFSYTYERI